MAAQTSVVRDQYLSMMYDFVFKNLILPRIPLKMKHKATSSAWDLPMLWDDGPCHIGVETYIRRDNEWSDLEKKEADQKKMMLLIRVSPENVVIEFDVGINWFCFTGPSIEAIMQYLLKITDPEIPYIPIHERKK